MDQKFSFAPPRRSGLLFQGGLIIIFGLASVLSLIQMLSEPIGGAFFLYMMAALLSFAVVPWAVYRWLALRGAYYLMERNGLRLHWGLRVEDVPMTSVRWVRSEKEVRQLLGKRLPLPFGHTPGAILGSRRLGDGSLLEYLAADVRHMVLISTDERVYVVSPLHTEEFIYTLQRLMELGTIAPLSRRSQYPTLVLTQVWQSRFARLLLLAGMGLGIGLFAWVSFLIPQLPEIYMGFYTADPSPPTQLLLLPILNSVFYLVNTLAGIFLYRRSILQGGGASDNPTARHGILYAYFLWGSSLISGVIFLFAISFLSYVG